MPRISLRFLVVFFTIVLSTSSAKANDCGIFTNRSVHQQDENLFNLCGYRGSQWTSSRKNLLRECAVMSKRDRNMRLSMRDKLLTSCLKKPNTTRKFSSLGRNRQQRLFTVLIRAIRLQDENLVRSVLNTGINIGRQPTWLKSSPLFVAMELKNYHLARILVRAGARPYLLASGEVNPISLLLREGPTNYAILEFLLQNKANPNVSGKNIDAEQPIVLASAKADVRSVNLLLKYKADANLYRDYPAIQKAVKLNHFPMTRALMNSGANPNLGLRGKVCRGKLALDIAYRRASERIINLLLDNRGLTESECKQAVKPKPNRQSTKLQGRNS